jgi:hypothetical protein
MFKRQLQAIGVVVIALGGCAIHPLPDDVTGRNTYQIVQKIRCEARDALGRKLIALFIADFSPPQTQEIGRALADGRLIFKTFDYRRLDPTTISYLVKYANSAIAYEFTFDITENNNLVGVAGLTYPFVNGTGTLGLGASHKLQRENKRNFRISDNFQDLLIKVDDSYCADVRAGKNWVYPITGSIGLGEMIDTFIDLDLSGNLTGKADTVPTMADTLTFQTSFSGSANPAIVLSPVTDRLRLTSASLNGDASRIDNHQVIVALSLPSGPVKLFIPGRTVRIVAPSARTPAEHRALDEIRLQKQLDFLNRIDTTSKLLGVP